MIAGSAATFGKQARGFWGGFHRWVLHQNSAPKERNRFKTLNRVQNSSFARCGALWRLQRSFSVRNLPLEGIVDALRGERRVEGLWQMTPELSPAPEPARVMVVEDEVLVRFPIAEALRASGLEVIEASNADEAWSYLLSGQTVDLIFSDIQMHVVLPFEALEHCQPPCPLSLESGDNSRPFREESGRFFGSELLAETDCRAARHRNRRMPAARRHAISRRRS